jgi:NTP pyrophosphatase (non-canonical NTP hydrolase)
MGTVQREYGKSMKKELELSYWYVIGDRLFGNVHNHPTIPDKSFVMTSKITKIEDSYVYTKNSKYKLLNGYFEIGEEMEDDISIIDSLIDRVLIWGYDKGIIAKGDAKAQTLKTVAEVGELADNIAKGADIKDDIGDILVTLILLAEIKDTSLHECLDIAYKEISKRTGKMVGGVFVKDE